MRDVHAYVGKKGKKKINKQIKAQAHVIKCISINHFLEKKVV